VGAQYPE